MGAQIFDREDFVWKLVERYLAEFFRGGPDLEKACVGRALMYGLQDHIPTIREVWAQARKDRAEDPRLQGHKEGA
jgi:hypothetical protein